MPGNHSMGQSAKTYWWWMTPIARTVNTHLNTGTIRANWKIVIPGAKVVTRKQVYIPVTPQEQKCYEYFGRHNRWLEGRRKLQALVEASKRPYWDKVYGLPEYGKR